MTRPGYRRLALALVAAGACVTDYTLGPGTITGLTVSPQSIEVGMGETRQLTAVARDQNGVPFVGARTQWSSANPAVATVSGVGAVTGVTADTTTVTVTAGAFSAAALVTVKPPPAIALSRSAVAFNAVASGPDPGPDSVDVTNAGGVALDDLTLDTVVYAGTPGGWLAAALSAPVAPTALVLAPATGSLPVGTYRATVRVRSARATNSPQEVTVTFTVSAGTPTQIAASAGDGQTAPAGTAVPVAPAAIVRDQFGNPVSGVSVTFAVASGGGSVTAAAATTDAAGIARVGSWTLGTVVGPNSLTATSPGLTGSPVTFSATGVAGPPASVQVAAGNGQAATVGTAVAIDPSVRVRDQFSNPVAGVAVSFAVASGGGSITGANATTDASGIAAVGSWTLGTTAGANSLTATVPGVTGSPVTFTATGVAGAATQIALSAGNGQSAPVGTAVAVAPSVVVRDQFNNTVAGVGVTFAVASGGGSITGATPTTNASGIAAVGSWTLGPTVGSNTLTATAPGLAGSPVTFTATATAGGATQIAISAGNAQTAPVNTTVPVAPAVVVRDQFNNPVQGHPVTFAVTGGGGSVTGASTTTNASGVATVGSWQLGTTAGANTLTATASGGGIAGNPVTFTATGTAGAATQIALNAGNNQTATVNTAVGVAPSVVVRDQFGNPVQGVAVAFAVTAGGGSVVGGSATTNASGIAQVTSWTLGTSAGTNNNTLAGTAAGLAGSPVTFTASATAAAASQIALNAGNGQTATVNTTVAVAPSVIVRDPFNNPVGGVSVTFAVTGGGGSLTGANATSNASGIAAAGSWRLGTAAGANALTATASGLAGSPVAFSATGVAGPATQVSKAAGDNQSATAGSTLPVAPAVLVGDQFNNPVAGVTVTYAVASGGGSITGATPTSGVNGLATLGSWTLGPTPGPNTLTATAAGLTGSPLTFSATGISGSARNLALAGGNAQTDTVRATLPVAYSVLVTDSAGNPVAGVTVSWAVTGGGGSITPASSNTNASGIATATRTLASTAGPHTATASVGGLVGSPVTFTATATAATATQMALNAGNNQTATVNTTVAVAPSVIVRDQFNNPVSGVAVTFAVSAGGGSVTGGNATTNAAGVATVGSWRLGTTAGTGNNALQATSAGLTGSPVTFTASATAGAATQMALNAGNNQTATVSTAVATAPSVLVRDQFSNPVSGHPVTFAVTGGGGSVSGGNATTNASGIAAPSSWTLGTGAGTNNNTLQATSAGLTGSPVTFTASATAGPPATVAINAGNNQTVTVNTAVPVAPSVVVRDQFSNPVAGALVTFSVTGGGGSVTGATPTTSASGIATVGSWTLGTVAGANTLQAVHGALTPASFTATGTAGAATQMALNAGNGQSATVNTAVATAPSVIVRDQFNNPVSGQAVTFAVTGGGGSVAGGNATTNATGIAAPTSWTLGTVAGTNTMQATSSGLAGSPVNFTATGTAGPVSAAQSTVTRATAMITACSSGCVAGTTASSITVTARDQFSNPINAVSVTISSTGSGNAFSPSASGTTNASGVYTANFSSTVAQAKTISATANAVAITQTAAVTVDPAAVSLSNSLLTASHPMITACSTSCAVGTTASTITATVRDAFNNLIAGASVTLSSTGSGNAFNPGPTGPTNASGVYAANFNSTAAQGKTISASVAGAGTLTTTVAVTVNAAPPNSVTVANQAFTARVGTGVATRPTFTVLDAFLNPVPNSAVTISQTGGGSLSPTGTTTNASGQVTLTSWILGGTGTETASGGLLNRATLTAGSASGTATDTAFYTWSGDVGPIIGPVATFPTTKCSDSCHYQNFNRNPNNIVGVADQNPPNFTACSGYVLVAQGNANNSLIYLKTAGTLVGGTPPCGNAMPNSNGLSATERLILRTWINRNALNN